MESGIEHSYNRRDLLRLAGAGVLGASALSGMRLALPSMAAADPFPRMAGWVFDRTLLFRQNCPGGVQQSFKNCPTEQALWTTLMRVDNKLGGAQIDNWYLWHWTHDAHVCRLYTAPSVTGPYTERGCNIPALTPDFDRTDHGLSAGDIVWHPGDRVFYATPHAAGKPGRESGHHTFLLRSTDGKNWSYVSETPILSPSAGKFDGFAASYARFLRTFNGDLFRFNGKAVLYYRGQPAGTNGNYTVGGATSSNLTSWTKMNGGNELFNPFSGALHGIGSAIWQPEQALVYLLFGVIGGSMNLRQGNRANTIDAWSDGPGIPIYQHTSPLVGGGSYVLAENGTHYMAFEALRADRPSYVVDLARCLT